MLPFGLNSINIPHQNCNGNDRKSPALDRIESNQKTCACHVVFLSPAHATPLDTVRLFALSVGKHSEKGNKNVPTKIPMNQTRTTTSAILMHLNLGGKKKTFQASD